MTKSLCSACPQFWQELFTDSIRVLAIEILAAKERTRIISPEVSCVSFDLSFISDLQYNV